LEVDPAPHTYQIELMVPRMSFAHPWHQRIGETNYTLGPVPRPVTPDSDPVSRFTFHLLDSGVRRNDEEN
jgi:hypothetical protein